MAALKPRNPWAEVALPIKKPSSPFPEADLLGLYLVLLLTCRAVIKLALSCSHNFTHLSPLRSSLSHATCRGLTPFGFYAVRSSQSAQAC